MTQNLRQTLTSQVRAVSDHLVDKSAVTEFWQDLFTAVVDQITDRWAKTDDIYAKGRQEHYFSAEFLMGRALLNSLPNLGPVGEARQAFTEYGQDLSLILGEEPGTALGNGGLEHLAAYFLDSRATLDLLVAGYGTLYRYGLLKQLFDKGFQTEHPDPWIEEGYPFVIRREEAQRIVSYADLTVHAVPYDMSITGYGTKDIDTLRLRRAGPVKESDYDTFDSQRFIEVIIDRERMNDTPHVLYSNDMTFEDKVLHVRQQYFFCSASLQAITDNYVEHHSRDLGDFTECNTIQLNDTYLVLAIPELIRLLMGEHGLGWGDTWKIVLNTFTYTNRTVLAEALEKWEVTVFDRLFPRIAEIVREIDRRLRMDTAERGLDQATIDHMVPVAGNTVHIAWTACYVSYSINSVAALHTKITKRGTLKERYELWPKCFSNKTNGVTPRRWLKRCNL